MREPSKCPKEKHAANPFLARKLLVFSASTNYEMVKIAHSSSEVV
jgi:hypothetical protein